MATIETERLLLRPMTSEDSTDLLAVFGDPNVMAAFDAKPFGTAEMARWVERNLRHQAEYGYGLFTVVSKETDAVIGDCGLERMDIGVELGYDLRHDCWNRGLATEAAIAVRDYAFSGLGIRRLASLIRVGNEASRRVAEKVGMTLTAQEDRHGTEYWIFTLDAPTST